MPNLVCKEKKRKEKKITKPFRNITGYILYYTILYHTIGYTSHPIMSIDTITLYICVDHPNERTESELSIRYRNAIDKFNHQKNGNKYMDSGFDLFVPENIYTRDLNIHEPIKLDHHVRIAAYSTREDNPRPYYLYPRSSISKTPYRLANQVGIIDSGYRGHVIAKMDDIRRFYSKEGFNDTSITSDDVYSSYYGEGNEERNVILKGTCLFQVCSSNLLPFDKVVLVNKNDTRMQTNVSERGEGGFGSTN